jgi:hypothetical protein
VESFGPVGCAGIGGTSSYGAGLVRHLKAAGISVMEVERLKRRHLRRIGKSGPIDAEAAAGAVPAGEAVGEPKSGDGKVEMIRVLRSARQSVVKARSQAANQLQALVVTAPEDLRHRLRRLPTKELLVTCTRDIQDGQPPLRVGARLPRLGDDRRDLLDHVLLGGVVATVATVAVGAEVASVWYGQPLLRLRD